MSDERLAAARERIISRMIYDTLKLHDIQLVLFQPNDYDVNQDGVIAEVWNIEGDRWLYIGVFDGHLGTTNIQYTRNTLATQLKRRLRHVLRHQVPGGLDRSNVRQHEPKITAALRREIENFDKSIGDALQRVCPNPSELDEQQARQIIQEHKDIVCRAFEGTTAAMVIINMNKRFMWAAGVGDSTVALSTVGEDGKRWAQRLCDVHTLKNPKEYFRATMAHKHQDEPIISEDDRVLDWLSVSRAIGDFALKLHASYLTHLFRCTPYGDKNPHILQYAPKIVTPPYIIAEPSIRFTDLDAVWGPQSKILLYTDGVDGLVDGYRTFRPEEHSGADPVQVVSALLADKVDPAIEPTLGHKIEPR